MSARTLALYMNRCAVLEAQLRAAGIIPTKEHDPNAVPLRMTTAASAWLAMERERQDDARRWDDKKRSQTLANT